jgi:hypothetical protein
VPPPAAGEDKVKDEEEKRGEEKRKRRGKERSEEKGDGKKEKTCRQKQFRLFTISIELVKPFCQTFSKTTPTLPEEPEPLPKRPVVALMRLLFPS